MSRSICTWFSAQPVRPVRLPFGDCRHDCRTRGYEIDCGRCGQREGHGPRCDDEGTCCGFKHEVWQGAGVLFLRHAGDHHSPRAPRQRAPSIPNRPALRGDAARRGSRGSAVRHHRGQDHENLGGTCDGAPAAEARACAPSRMTSPPSWIANLTYTKVNTRPAPACGAVMRLVAQQRRPLVL